jgi:hypothetical protein
VGKGKKIMTSKEAAVKPQDVPTPKTWNATTAWLALLVGILATLVITAISCWFLFSNIHGDARAAVLEDMKIVSKAQEQ